MHIFKKTWHQLLLMAPAIFASANAQEVQTGANDAAQRILKTRDAIESPVHPSNMKKGEWRTLHAGKTIAQQRYSLDSTLNVLHGADDIGYKIKQDAFIKAADKFDLFLDDARTAARHVKGYTRASRAKKIATIDQQEDRKAKRYFEDRHDDPQAQVAGTSRDTTSWWDALNKVMAENSATQPGHVVEPVKPDVDLAPTKIKLNTVSDEFRRQYTRKTGLEWKRGAPGPRIPEDPVFVNAERLSKSWLRHRISLGGVPDHLDLADSTEHWDAMVKLYEHESKLKPAAKNTGKHYNRKTGRWVQNTAAYLPQVVEGTQRLYRKKVGKPYPRNAQEARSLEGIDTQIDYTNAIYDDNLLDAQKHHINCGKDSFVGRVFIAQETYDQPYKNRTIRVTYHTPCVATVKNVAWVYWAGAAMGDRYVDAHKRGRKIGGYPIAPNTPDGQPFSKYLKILAQPVGFSGLLQQATNKLRSAGYNVMPAFIANMAKTSDEITLPDIHALPTARNRRHTGRHGDISQDAPMEHLRKRIEEAKRRRSNGMAYRP